jgi:segregation and condensation protein B
VTDLERQLEALLFLAPDPVPVEELADALRVEEDEVEAGLRALAAALDGRGVVLRELAGGWTLASHPDAEEAARRLLARPRTPGLTPAQAETLSIVAYLQPVSRPEVARIRGVAAESATTSLVERGLIEEAGRSQFGAILYRTTPLFLKLFGLRSLDDLPDPAQWDPTPEEEADLRDRLLRAGEARAGGGAPAQPTSADAA